jgi:hypothetical protein
MISASGGALLGDIKAMAVSNRGFTPEELVDGALNQIIYVGSNSHPAIREQAEAFKALIRQVLLSYGHQCINSNKTTLANRFRDAGHPELTKLLEN